MVTAPLAITILRTVLLFVSATYRLVPSVVMPPGPLKRAAVPVASVEPVKVAVPAGVVTAPLAITILRTVLLP